MRRYTEDRRYGSSVRERLTQVLVGLLAAGLSLGRLLWSDSTRLTENLWAEDGLFPLCVVKGDFVSCLVDPFSGYFLFVPRVGAGLISLLPMEQWALAANALAATIAGVAAMIAWAAARRSGASWSGSLLTSLLVVLAPIVGLEAINALGSAYIPLVFASTLALAFPPEKRGGKLALGVLLGITVLTIPSAGVLLVGVGVLAFRRVIVGVWVVVYGVILLVGLATQWLVGRTAETPRNLELTSQGIDGWFSTIPSAVVSFWPGLTFGEGTIFGMFDVTPFALTGLAISAGVLSLGIWSAVRGDVGISVLILSGLGVGLIPTVTGYANNRYFVLPALLWAAAAILVIDRRWAVRHRWLMPTLLVASVVLWTPALPVSEFRGTTSPPWSLEVERLRAECAGDPARTVQVRFSPDWPRETTQLDPITTADALCFAISPKLGIELGQGFGS